MPDDPPLDFTDVDGLSLHKVNFLPHDRVVLSGIEAVPEPASLALAALGLPLLLRRLA